MKFPSILLILIAAAFAGCATPPPAKISFGPSQYRVDHSLSNYRSIDYPVRLENISNHPIWYYGFVQPGHTIYTRPTPRDRWTEDTWRRMCGMADSFHKVAPGESTYFGIFFPATQSGQQFRLELSVFDSPDNKSKPFRLRTPAMEIR